MATRSFASFLCLLPAISLFASGDTSASAAEATKPNIIFILADDLGYGDLSCYGQQMIRTPNLDRMAAEGMRFTQCYAGSTVCAPSRCALMLGQHTGHCLVRGNDRVPLRPQDVTVAEVLKAAGYTTALIGKWGLGEPGTPGHPLRQGFDYFFGYTEQRHAHNYYPEFLWRNNERVVLKNEVAPEWQGQLPGVAVRRVEYSHDLFVADALRFVEENRDKPFFLYLALTIPHANNEAGKEGMEVPELGEYAEKDWPAPEKGKAAMIARMDRDIGVLLAQIKKLGIDQQTVVFFSSDNGPHREGGADPTFFRSSGELRGIKRDLYEGGIRVPMIVRWPGKIAPGVNDHVWAFWDFLPTAAELAGAAAPAEIDGISVVPTLLGRPGQKQHEFLYWEFHEGGSKQAVRMGDWKAVRLSPEAPLQLYRLNEDLAEKKDIAAEHPEVVAKIEAYLKTARTESEHWPLRTKPVTPKKPKATANPTR